MARIFTWRSVLAFGCVLAAPIAVLSAATPQASAAGHRAFTAARSTPQQTTLIRVLPWGDGPGQVGLRPMRQDHPAEGVSAVSVGPDGRAYLLDRLHGQVLQFDATRPNTEVSVAARVPVHAEDLAVGDDGAIAVHSPLQSRVLVFDGGGAAGQVEIPRALRDTVNIALGPSRQVLVANAFQETLNLGSPATPRSVDAVLHSRREGAVILADGTGLSVKLGADRTPELVWIRKTDTRSSVVARHKLGGPVLSARLLGSPDGVACVAMEHRAAGPGFRVTQEIACVNAKTGAELSRTQVPANPLYLPRRAAALGGSPPRLVLLHPGADGLHIITQDLAGRVQEVQP